MNTSAFTLRSERGQSLVLTLIFMTVLLGMVAVVLDVGSWYRADRKLQANADAAALAGAQELPDAPAAAVQTAIDYGDENDGGVAADNVTVRSTINPNDALEVVAERPAPGVFTRLFGLDSVDVRARAVARTGVLGKARFAAPVAVDWEHPKLQCGRPCWGTKDTPGDLTTIDFTRTGPGAFRLINIDGSYGGIGSDDIGEWIRSGLDAWMDKDRWYYSDPGMKPNSSHIRNAIDFREGTELLFPVYNQTRAQGAGFEYFVIGFTVFHVTGHNIRGSRGEIHGYFVDMIWTGIHSETSDEESFGARAVSLIE